MGAASPPPNGMVTLQDAERMADGLGFQRLPSIYGSTFRDSSTFIVVPTRGTLHQKAVQGLMGLIAPMNQKRAIQFAVGHEVGRAYDAMIEFALGHPEIGKWKYVLTIEDDNAVPPDAHVRLLESIDYGPFDAVGGIYFTKGDLNMPMCYGDARAYAASGVLDFAPLDVRDALSHGNIVECNGLAMGCTLYRMELFRQIPKPWFVTTADVVPDKGIVCMTQDLWFCERAKRMGKRFAVDMRVKVGHVDTGTGIVY